jgi:hypothetical protein
MVKQLGFHWITVEDEYGQDPAIQFGETSIIAFPLTMVSKRVERGEALDVRDLYEQTRRALTAEDAKDAEEEEIEEQHPANTLNDRSALKFVFWVPAFVLHTLIAAMVCPVGVTLASIMLGMRPSFGRYFWPGFLLEFAFAFLMGYAWTKRLDRWFFGTSRWVWILPSIWLLVRVLTYRPDVLAGTTRFEHFLGRADDLAALGDQLLVVVPFVCAIGYALGARYRRTKGDVLHEKLKAFTAEAQRR